MFEQLTSDDIVFGGLVLVAIIGGLVAVVSWRYKLSIKRVPADYVAMRTFMAEPEPCPPKPESGEPPIPWQQVIPPRMYTSGPMYVPWIPLIQFDGHYIYESAMIPRGLWWASFEGEEDDGIVDSDGVILLPKIDMSVRFPFNDPPACRQMVKSSVPMDMGPAFQAWARNEVITVAKDILAGWPYKESRSKGKLVDINKEANELLRQEGSLFVRSGVFGTDIDNSHEGMGEVTIRFKLIPLRPELQAKIDGLAGAKVDAEAAKSIAEEEKQRVYGPILLATGKDKIESEDEAVELRKMALAGNNAIYAKQVNSYQGLPPGLTYFGGSGGGGGKLGVFADSSKGPRTPGGGKKRRPIDPDNDDI